LSVPVTALVSGLVVWYVKVAGTDVRGARLQPVATPACAALIMVANAVAVVPTWTDRLLGKTAATRDCALLIDGSNTNIRTRILPEKRPKAGHKRLAACILRYNTRVIVARAIIDLPLPHQIRHSSPMVWPASKVTIDLKTKIFRLHLHCLCFSRESRKLSVATVRLPSSALRLRWAIWVVIASASSIAGEVERDLLPPTSSTRVSTVRFNREGMAVEAPSAALS
jgi:hypothetical protein